MYSIFVNNTSAHVGNNKFKNLAPILNAFKRTKF